MKCPAVIQSVFTRKRSREGCNIQVIAKFFFFAIIIWQVLTFFLTTFDEENKKISDSEYEDLPIIKTISEDIWSRNNDVNIRSRKSLLGTISDEKSQSQVDKQGEN